MKQQNTGEANLNPAIYNLHSSENRFNRNKNGSVISLKPPDQEPLGNRRTGRILTDLTLSSSLSNNHKFTKRNPSTAHPAASPSPQASPSPCPLRRLPLLGPRLRPVTSKLRRRRRRRFSITDGAGNSVSSHCFDYLSRRRRVFRAPSPKSIREPIGA
ncbi:hypothetical protein PIB30_016550 [Stylosanthes scabra]|uniref:Uncharacterized protein n=1 Tax=Stylosanthes scabra TaxID=79078 RepID=A0ABU6R7L5_9FABA|nr:hypothetical protein [Stylosanthes scabra]